MKEDFDLTIILGALALLLILFANIANHREIKTETIETSGEIPVVETQQEFQHEESKETELIKEEKEELTINLEEECEITCLFYATIPIGRYYITAYNHEETGSKITASGKTCHEGVITTCASDIRYLPFGTYLEIGNRLFVCEDTGSAVKKKHVDIYFKDYKKMAKYNSHYETIYKVEFPFGKPKM